jgi:hypothetical protein
MGAWGVNILEEDCAADMHGEYIEHFNTGESHDEILAAMIKTNHELLEDEDDRIGFWLGVSKAQWECGALSQRALDEVKQIVETGAGLDLWGEPGEKVRRDRERALNAFLKKLATPNPKAKKRRKGIVRKPVFQAGDCLAIRLRDGDYAAAIVTATVEEAPRPGADTYGINVVAQLRYKSSEKPGAAVFESREWLMLTWGAWGDWAQGYWPRVTQVMSLRFKAVQDRFEVVGRTVVRADDPQTSKSISSWDFAEQVVQHFKFEGK